MKISDEALTHLRKFAPYLEKTSFSWYFSFVVFFIFWMLGIYALVLQIRYGHDVTGMRDYVVWGIYIVNFIFFMGLSYAGALLNGVKYLFNAEWRKPVTRFTELFTAIALIVGPVNILFCIGRFDRLHYLFVYPRIQSPITWDIIAVVTDLVGCFLYMYLSLIEDFALLRDYDALKVPKWKKKFYTLMAFNYHGTPEQKKILKTLRDIMSAMMVAVAITVYSVLAWIFSLTLQPGWHSTIFAPYFVVAAIFSGTCLLIILMWLFRKIYKLEDYITSKHFNYVGILLLVISAFYGYFTFSDYLSRWYGSTAMDTLLINRLFSHYFWQFIFANYIGILIPLIVMALPRLRTIGNITFASVIALLGIWMNRFLIVVPSLETPYLPIQDARTEWLHYSPTWIEYASTGGAISVFCMLFMLAFKFVPVVAVSEVSSE